VKGTNGGWCTAMPIRSCKRSALQQAATLARG